MGASSIVSRTGCRREPPGAKGGRHSSDAQPCTVTRTLREFVVEIGAKLSRPQAYEVQGVLDQRSDQLPLFFDVVLLCHIFDPVNDGRDVAAEPEGSSSGSTIVPRTLPRIPPTLECRPSGPSFHQEHGL
jgi:hypothetical protein